MKKFLFVLFLFFAGCMESDQVIKQEGFNARILVDPGCRGGQWFQSSTIGQISPFTYGEWLTIEVKANIPQTGWKSMGAVQVVYRLTNHSGPSIAASYIQGQNSQYGNFQGGGMAAGTYKDITFTVPTCIALPAGPSNYMIFGFQVKFLKGPGAGTSNIVSGQIISAEPIDCPNNIACYEPYRHKKATFEQGWSSSLSMP